MLRYIRLYSDTFVQNALKEKEEKHFRNGRAAAVFKNSGIASWNDSTGKLYGDAVQPTLTVNIYPIYTSASATDSRELKEGVLRI